MTASWNCSINSENLVEIVQDMGNFVWKAIVNSLIFIYYDSHGASRRLKSRKLQVKSSHEWWLCRLSSRLGAKSSRKRKPKWLPCRSIPHCQCWIANLSNLLSLQYKENKGKCAFSNGRLKPKSFDFLSRLLFFLRHTLNRAQPAFWHSPQAEKPDGIAGSPMHSGRILTIN